MRVLNKRIDKIPPDAVYVGRHSKWGNPFTIGKDGTREEVIAKYHRYLFAMGNYELLSSIKELKGKDLVCWCSPLPCHADILLELANKDTEMHFNKEVRQWLKNISALIVGERTL